MFWLLVDWNLQETGKANLSNAVWMKLIRLQTAELEWFEVNPFSGLKLRISRLLSSLVIKG